MISSGVIEEVGRLLASFILGARTLEEMGFCIILLFDQGLSQIRQVYPYTHTTL
jgi:hypothetical protein